MITVIDKDSELKLLAKSYFAGLAEIADFKNVDLDEVMAIKSDTSEPRTRFEVIELAQKVGDDGSRVRRFCANNEKPSRDGDIIRVKGWDFTDFRKNPIALWCHRLRDLPIGLVGGFEKDLTANVPALYETIDFLGADLYAFADQCMKFVDAKAIRGVSVSLLPKAGGIRVPATAEERQKIGLGPWGVEYVAQSQLELSLCPLPCHPEALREKAFVQKTLGEMVARKEITEAVAKQLMAATEGPKVFAVAHVEDKGVGSSEEDGGAAKTALTATVDLKDELTPVLASLNTTLEALTKKLSTDEARDARVNALERDIVALTTKANGAPVAPATQTPIAETNARAGADFYTKAFEAIDARRN